jgi:hypothetical protein
LPRHASASATAFCLIARHQQSATLPPRCLRRVLS